MKKLSLIFLLLTFLFATAILGLRAFKNTSPENLLFYEVISCRINGCKGLFADFHDFSRIKKIPEFITIATDVEKVTFNVYELEDISALLKLEHLKYVDVSRAYNLSRADVDALTKKGVIVHSKYSYEGINKSMNDQQSEIIDK